MNRNITWSYKPWGSIIATSDASVKTTFRFSSPIDCSTGKEYAIVIKYEGNEDYIIWTSKKGDPLVGGTNAGQPSPGVSGQFIGNLYTYVSPTSLTANPSTNTSIGTNSSNTGATTTYSQQYLLSTWKPINDTDLKFEVNVSRYFINGDPVFNVSTNSAVFNNTNSLTKISNNHIRAVFQSIPTEYVTFNYTQSNCASISYGDTLYQNQPYYSGGKITAATCRVSNGSQLIQGNTSFTVANGSTFNWNYLYSNAAGITQTIVVTSLNHDGAGQHRVDIRNVTAVNASHISVDKVLSFTNTAAKFFVAPTARLTARGRTRGIVNGKMSDIMTLVGSTANSSCRFVNNVVESYTIVANGTGYANSDYIVLTGYEQVTNELYGGYSAYANIGTNANGSITSVYITNAGAGFTNTQNMVVTIKNANNDVSGGTGANVTFTTGCTLKSELSDGEMYYANCNIVNIEANQIIPGVNITKPAGVNYQVTHRNLYYRTNSANTISGKAYFAHTNSQITDLVIESSKLYNFQVNVIPALVSRSNQFSIRYPNGTEPANSVIGDSGNSNTIVFVVDLVSNNDFTMSSIGNSHISAQYAKYIINNDYTNENINYGNAYAKHVTTESTFANGRTAEDMIVYLTGFRPVGTDFKVFVRLHNATDDEALELKDWTLLEQTDGLNVYSNPYNQNDMKEFTYGIPQYPNNVVQTGSVTTVLNQSNVTGSGTTFTSNIAVGDIVKLYQPLFPNNYMISVVNTVTNNTLLTLEDNISNNGLVGSGLKIARISYPKQAFRNILNSNVASYYSNSGIKYDGYNSFQLKVVFLSNNDLIVPKLDDERGLGVTT